MSSYRELFERQLGRARARLQEEREARERSAVEATQAKAKLQACEAELQSAMATIAALRAQGQPSEGLPPPRDGGPPGQVRARLPRFACLSFVALVFNLTACRRSCCRGRSPRGARQRSLLRPVCATSEPNAQFATGCSNPFMPVGTSPGKRSSPVQRTILARRWPESSSVSSTRTLIAGEKERNFRPLP